MTEEQLKEIEKLAKLVPRNGKIVEVGSYLGRSSYAWAKSCHPSVSVFCIDHWSGWVLSESDFNNTITQPEGWKPGLACSLENFKKYTKKCKNIIPIKAYSPFIEWKKGSIDLVFIDDGHEYENTLANIYFWKSKLKNGGILCGDDYSSYWPDVIKAVNEITMQLKKEVKHNVTHFWQIEI